jgi:hypothetical protein
MLEKDGDCITVLISPYSRSIIKPDYKLITQRNDFLLNSTPPYVLTCAKNYLYWVPFLEKLKESGGRKRKFIQFSLSGEPMLCPGLIDNVYYDLSLPELRSYIAECHYWISVDNFFQHLANEVGKPGVVIFTKSKPSLFGHPQNLNLYLGKARKFQFDLWASEPIDLDSQPDPDLALQLVSIFEDTHIFCRKLSF